MKLPGLNSMDVCTMLQAACRAAGGQKVWADRHGISQSYVSDVLNARREPGESILRALKLRKVVRYVEVRSGEGS